VSKWWRWRGFSGDPDSSTQLPFDWYAPLTHHRHFPYSRRHTAGEDDLRIRLTIHSDSFLVLAEHNAVELLNAISGFHHQELLRVVTTPTSLPSPEWSTEFEEVHIGEEFDRSHGLKARKVRCGTRLTSTPSRVPTMFDFERICGTRLPDLEAKHLQSLWHVLGAHKALDGDVFVTCDPVLLRTRATIGANLSVWILKISEALDFCESTWKSEGSYRLRHFTQTDRFTYYLRRRQDLVPSTHKLSVALWPTRTSSSDELEYLASISDRLGYLLEAHDAIGVRYYQSAEMDPTDSMLYHLNFFMMLVTATLDNVAWVLKKLFGVSCSRLKTTLRRKSALRKQLGCNTAVSDALARWDGFIEVFYPMRDQVAHRHRIWGAGFLDDKRGDGAILAEVEQEFATAIAAVDREEKGSPYSCWGLFECEGAIFLEPYRFARQAVIGLSALVNETLEAAIISRGLDAGTSGEITHEYHSEFSIPFPQKFI
jgi:hypothetical protein